MEQIRELIARIIKEQFGVETDVQLTRTEEKFGDYATNVALQLSKQVGNPLYSGPRDIAEAIVEHLQAELVAKAEVAGPGFINLTLSDAALLELINTEPAKPLTGKVAVAEYSDPNPFKVLHAGHLYTSVVGDVIANLLQHAGAVMHRVNFGGDVGLHVGKTMWAILQKLGDEQPDKLAEVPAGERAEWMADAYVKGTAAYEDDQAARAAIIQLNKRVYALHASHDRESDFARIYWACRSWSYDYFNDFYDRIGTKFDKYYPESEVADLGLKTVREQQDRGVFVESDGAVVFKGEEHGLHTRVFINGEGLPTYEAKDVGLIMTKWADYHFDKSIIITGNEQEQYLAVVLKAVEQFAPELAQATTHLTHGIVKLQAEGPDGNRSGVKMSSRKGNILRAVDVLDAAARANQAATGKDQPDIVLGAVKYAFLKQRIGGDIIYNPAESVALEGNSGPYLQYAHARACSILRKAEGVELELSGDLQPGERSLARKIGEFNEVVATATAELMPHHIATYLYELAQTFNRFYEGNRVIGNDRQNLRLGLVAAYAYILKQGLGLLGIHAPEHM